MESTEDFLRRIRTRTTDEGYTVEYDPATDSEITKSGSRVISVEHNIKKKKVKECSSN